MYMFVYLSIIQFDAVYTFGSRPSVRVLVFHVFSVESDRSDIFWTAIALKVLLGCIFAACGQL